MENILLRQLENVLCEGMKVPEELRRLYQWIEDNGFYEDREGIRYGYLYPQQALRDSWTDTEREGGTIISFYADSRKEQDETVTRYYGNKDEEISSRLCIFSQTGAEGSMGALWLDDEGETRIVHLGSGSGSAMLCTLAQNGLDFLRPAGHRLRRKSAGIPNCRCRRTTTKTDSLSNPTCLSAHGWKHLPHHHPRIGHEDCYPRTNGGTGKQGRFVCRMVEQGGEVKHGGKSSLRLPSGNRPVPARRLRHTRLRLPRPSAGRTALSARLPRLRT